MKTNTAPAQLALFAVAPSLRLIVTPHDVTDFRTECCKHSVDSACDHCDPAAPGYTDEQLWELAGDMAE